MTGTATAQETPTVSMSSDYFDPVGLLVEPGTAVRFEVESGSHSVTAYEDRIPSGATAFDSGTISAGSFEYTFEEPGTYDYYCLPHQSMGMTGRIVVGGPGGPAEATPIPHGEVPDSDVIVDEGRIGANASGNPGDDGHRGMRGRGPGPGGMDGGGKGWHMLVPAGFLTAVFGATVGAIYWRSGSEETESGDDPAIAELRAQLARGEIDEAEYEQRLERLAGDEKR